MLWGLVLPNAIAQTAETTKGGSDAAWDAYADAKVLGTPSGAIQTYAKDPITAAAAAPKKKFPTGLVLAGAAAALGIFLLIRSTK